MGTLLRPPEVFVDSWLTYGKEMCFITPNPALFCTTTKVASKVAASSLNASRVEGVARFHMRDIKDVTGHVDFSRVSGQLKSIVTQRLSERPNLYVFIVECVSQMKKHRSRLRDHTILNETGVRYVYGDSIIDMLVDGLQYSMQFEECVETSETAAAPLSRNCCWKLYKANGESCVTVLETKHSQVRGYEMKSIAQVLGYYCCMRKASNVPGICILLNEYNEVITITIFLFPYFEDGVYGAQSLVLPQIKTKDTLVLDEKIVALILALSISDDQPLQFKCPESIVDHTNIVVYTDDELKANKLADMKDELEQKMKELEQKDKAIAALEEKNKELEETS